MGKRAVFSMAVSMIISVLIVFYTARTVVSMFLYRGQGNMQVAGAMVFRYFTVLSNILSAAASVVMLAFQTEYIVRRFSGGWTAANQALQAYLPRWAVTLRFAGTVAVGVTLMTVLLFLGPMIGGYGPLLAGNNFYLHLSGPLLATAALVFFDFPQPLGLAQVWFTVLPTFLYACLYLYKVVVLGTDRGGWPDFYGFNAGGRWPLSFVLMIAGTYLLGWILRLLHNAAGRFWI